jgi:prophage antirepressor-like protein
MSIANIILELYDNIIKINNKNIIILFDKSKNIWFSLSDLLKALNYSAYRDEIKSINNYVNKEDLSTYENIINETNKTNKKIKNELNIQPHTKMISEGGLYLLLNKSRKPLAIKLKKELYTQILPQIRKHGQYKINNNDKKKMKELTKKIKLYQFELKRTKKKSYLNETKKGFIYIIKIKTIHNGDNKTCYKIGYTSNLEKRISTYKTGNPDIEIVYHENLKCNKKQLESCIINLNILKKLKNKTEIICDVSLEKIKEEIQDCKKLLAKYS